MGSLFIDGDFLWYVFGFQKDRIKFIWEETDASTEEVFKDISFGFDITNDIGKLCRQWKEKMKHCVYHQKRI